MPYPYIAYQLALTSVANATNPPGSAVYTGTVTGGNVSSGFVGCQALISGFPVIANGSNNGTFPILASNATSVTVTNPLALAANATASLTVLSVSPTTGPFLASGATGGAPPFSSPPATGTLIVDGAPDGASLTAKNFQGGWNYTHGELAMQVDLDTIEGPQQGVNAIANVTSTTLAGYPLNTTSFVQWQGGFNSVK